VVKVRGGGSGGGEGDIFGRGGNGNRRDRVYPESILHIVREYRNTTHKTPDNIQILIYGQRIIENRHNKVDRNSFSPDPDKNVLKLVLTER
jgi:hypothetical protein